MSKWRKDHLGTSSPEPLEVIIIGECRSGQGRAAWSSPGRLWDQRSGARQGPTWPFFFFNNCYL